MHYAVEDKSISPWIAKTTFGYLVGGTVWAVLTLATGYLQTNDNSAVWLVQLASIGVAGVATGVFQGGHIQTVDTRIPARRWIVVTATGMVLGLSIVGALSFFLGTWALNFPLTGAEFTPLLDNGSMSGVSMLTSMAAGLGLLMFGAIFAFVYGALDGLAVGLLQWLVIKPYLRESYWWALINMMAVAAAGVVVLVASWLGGYAAGEFQPVEAHDILAALVGLAVWGAMGLVLGLLSAPVLNWLLREPIEEGRLL